MGVGWIDRLRVSGCIHTLEFLRRPVAEGGVQASSIVYLLKEVGESVHPHVASAAHDVPLPLGGGQRGHKPPASPCRPAKRGSPKGRPGSSCLSRPMSQLPCAQPTRPQALGSLGRGVASAWAITPPSPVQPAVAGLRLDVRDLAGDADGLRSLAGPDRAGEIAVERFVEA